MWSQGSLARRSILSDDETGQEYTSGGEAGISSERFEKRSPYIFWDDDFLSMFSATYLLAKNR